MELKQITDNLEGSSKEDLEILTKAYLTAEKAHEGQYRESGEPYFNHLFETALILTKLKMKSPVIAAGLLHDSVEDGKISPKYIQENFGREVAELVEGVTKLGTVKYRGLKRHVESLRKFFIATAQDPRIIIIKLADRLHNMRTLEHLPESKRRRISLETMEIYAPLAHRLGVGAVKGELEDLAFKNLYPEEYSEVRKLLKDKSSETLERLENILKSLKKLLAKEGVRDIKTDYRVKHIYSLYKKLLKNDMDLSKVYDISSLRVIVDDIPTCYQVLGIIHSKWRPLPTRIKDYVAFPKPNGYRSLHTTVFTGDGGIVEIQIRTPEMHRDAEYGIASHVKYKESGGSESQSKDTALEWLQELAESQAEITRSDHFMKSLKNDFFDQRIFVFTPKGDVIDLPTDSSPIDFAYAIHSDIGNHVSSVRVNGKMSPLKTKLKNGDIVEIVTKNSSKPSRKWLEYAKTTLAKKKIKNYLSSFNDKSK